MLVLQQLIVLDPADHDFNPKQNEDFVQPAMLGWFEQHLAEKKDR
jgi:hypothetical protein